MSQGSYFVVVATRSLLWYLYQRSSSEPVLAEQSGPLKH